MKLLSRQEELILLAIWHLQGNAYGVTIRRYLIEVTDEHWSLAAVYVPLDRFEKNGFVSVSPGSTAPGRGGRRKRLYKLMPAGVEALHAVKQLQEEVWMGFPGPVLRSNPGYGVFLP